MSNFPPSRIRWIWLVAVFGAVLWGADGAVRMPAVFGDRMVLQQSGATPVWGWAEPGEEVTVAMAGVEESGKADGDGKWQVRLDLRDVGAGPHRLTVEGDGRIELNDVLVGEVWLASGQSNMLFRLAKTIGANGVIARSANPQIREFFVTEDAERYPQEDCDGEWTLASPETTPLYSGVAYHFARILNEVLQRPIGILNASSGGTMAEAWMSLEALEADPDLGRGARANLAEGDALIESQRAFGEAVAELAEQTNRPDEPSPPDWISGAAAEGKWESITLPGKASDGPGIFWLRKTVDLPADKTEEPLTLGLEVLTGFETVFWNGERVAGTRVDAYPGENFPRLYQVPSELLRIGENTLLIRVYSPLGPVVFSGKASRFRAASVNLKGPWEVVAERTFPPLTGEQKQALTSSFRYLEPKSRAASLFNGMIHPLIPYGIAGILWYQGESNAKRAWQYRTTLPLLIADWRRRWGRDEMPFYICQLAGYRPQPSQAPAGSWAELREAQTLATELPGVEQAVLIDIGEEEDIHPRNKEDAGKRLAAIALAKTYGQPVAYSGPVFDSFSIEGDAVRVRFDHAESGLVATPLPFNYQPSSLAKVSKPLVRNRPDSEVEGFSIAGEDGTWHWADARIDGSTVVVSSPAVPEPVAVRYAWADFPIANLTNGDGFPATPFRTDDQPAVTRAVQYGLTDPEAEQQ